jgi:hypothetical protein
MEHDIIMLHSERFSLAFGHACSGSWRLSLDAVRCRADRQRGHRDNLLHGGDRRDSGPSIVSLLYVFMFSVCRCDESATTLFCTR